MIKECKYCGKQFDTSNTDGLRKYCSEECQKAAFKEYQRVYTQRNRRRTPRPKKLEIASCNKIVRACVICGAEFFTGRGGRICCSEECSTIRKRQLAKERRAYYKKRPRASARLYELADTETQPACEKKGIEYHLLTPLQKLFYGETQSKAYADNFKVIIPEGLTKAKDRMKL